MATEKNDNNLKMSYLELFPPTSNFVFFRNRHSPTKKKKKDSKPSHSFSTGPKKHWVRMEDRDRKGKKATYGVLPIRFLLWIQKTQSHRTLRKGKGHLPQRHSLGWLISADTQFSGPTCGVALIGLID